MRPGAPFPPARVAVVGVPPVAVRPRGHSCVVCRLGAPEAPLDLWRVSCTTCGRLDDFLTVDGAAGCAVDHEEDHP